MKRSEAKALGVKHYETGKACRHGHVGARFTSTGQCVVCSTHREARLRQADPQGFRARRASDMMNWREANRERARANDRAHYQKHKEKIRKRKVAWREANRDKHRLSCMVRNKRHRAATAWAFIEQIRLIYATKPKGWTVDHEIPLDHPLVCGWHHPNNLTHMERGPNSSKNNTFDVERYPGQGQLRPLV